MDGTRSCEPWMASGGGRRSRLADERSGAQAEAMDGRRRSAA